MVRNKPSSPTESEHMSMRPVRNVASLLAAANTILSDVDQSDFLEGNARREYPTITRDEIRIGDVLGIGGFSIVSEVAAIIPRDNTLKDNDVHEATAKQPWHKTEEEQALEDDIEPEHQHFEFDTAKKQLASRCLRSNKARYAIKRLDPMLSDIDRARGMIDMALEGIFCVSSSAMQVRMLVLSTLFLINSLHFLSEIPCRPLASQQW